MNRIQALKAKLIEKTDALGELLKGGNDLSADELKVAGDLQVEIRSLKSEYQIAETLEESKAFLDTPAQKATFGVNPVKAGEAIVTDTPEARKMETEVKGISEKVWAAISTKVYSDAFRAYLGGGIHKLGATDLKALQEGADQSGGFTVPEQVMQQLLVKKPAPTRLPGLITNYQTARDSLTIPKVIYTTDDTYTTGVRATLTGEIPIASTIAAITDPKFGQVKIDVFTHMLSGQLTRDIIEDSLFDLGGYLANFYGQAVDLLKESYIVGGTGIGQPIGITASPSGTVGGLTMPSSVNVGNGMTGDGVLGLAWSIPPQYDENCYFAFNKMSVGKALVQLKDSSNRYLFTTGSGDGMGGYGIATARPKELVGYPFVYSQLMSDVGANNYIMIFGDFSGYVGVERVGLTIQVLDQTKAKDNQIELVGRWRWGGVPAEDWKLKVGKQA